MKVKISGQQTIYYNQTVEMDEDEFIRLSALLDENMDEDLTEEIADYLDLTDISNWEPMEECIMERVDE